MNENTALRKKIRALGANVAGKSSLQLRELDCDYPQADGFRYGPLPQELDATDLVRVKPKKPGKDKDAQRYGFEAS